MRQVDRFRRSQPTLILTAYSSVTLGGSKHVEALKDVETANSLRADEPHVSRIFFLFSGRSTSASCNSDEMV